MDNLYCQNTLITEKALGLVDFKIKLLIIGIVYICLIPCVCIYSGPPLFQPPEMRTPLYTVDPLYSNPLK